MMKRMKLAAIKTTDCGHFIAKKSEVVKIIINNLFKVYILQKKGMRGNERKEKGKKKIEKVGEKSLIIDY